MKSVSNAYKEAMNETIRERGYISVVLSEVNGIAQNDCVIATNGSYWSDKQTPFNNDEQVEYATFEEDFVKADGKTLFMPEPNSGLIQDAGFCTPQFLQAVRFNFGNTYAIKGLTIDFGTAYPTEFKITTSADGTGRTYTITDGFFETTDTLGEISWITITPISMVGGEQRLRIKRILMGIGLSYGNDEVIEATLTEEISPISETIPSTSFTVKILDKENLYNVNNVDSFMDYLITGQKVSIAYGMALDDTEDNIEWIRSQTLDLSNWSSKDGEFSFSATDVFATQNNTYTLGNRIYTRTAYAEAESILQDLGLQPDEYHIDNYLREITLTNPMPEDTHANCLLLLCNACRCIYYQNEDGVIFIQGNFALNIAPENINLTTEGAASYSYTRNIFTQGLVTTHYADFSKNSVPADGTYKFLPSYPSQYDGHTGFVSAEVSNVSGRFTNTPAITLELEAAYTFYSLYVNFAGQPPRRINVTTYKDNTQVSTHEFTNLQAENVLRAEFGQFDKMRVAFTVAYPYSRVSVDYLGIGNLTDYLLDKNTMTSRLIGTKETEIKDVRVKRFSYQLDENNKPVEVKDDVWYTHTINPTGQHIEVKNPLISSQTMAQNLAEWLGVHYDNNYTYEVDYRGEPRLNATDIIKVEDDYMNNLQTEITKSTLKFDGGYSGTLEMRRAVNDN